MSANTLSTLRRRIGSRPSARNCESRLQSGPLDKALGREADPPAGGERFTIRGLRGEIPESVRTDIAAKLRQSRPITRKPRVVIRPLPAEGIASPAKRTRPDCQRPGARMRALQDTLMLTASHSPFGRTRRRKWPGLAAGECEPGYPIPPPDSPQSSASSSPRYACFPAASHS